MKKGNKLYSILYQKCPRCHEGKLFNESNPYKISKIFDMPDECPKCGQVYALEPSFYYGSMYVNYGLTVGMGVGVFLLMRLFSTDWELMDYLIGITITIVASIPLTFRLGRAIWINMFVNYESPSK